ncbi:hypothetical protein BOO91_09755 [Vibrio navarrensis]|uniref:DUF423 domain-containing protein n=1 Tax=Vibrio navarrensis TaxID=29495 RepID=A0AAJ4ICG8_9VIBR|nr:MULTISPECIES: DUF423 domain-containing protein [Vibrio]KJR29211.1 membrane protein [Vibrio sp. S234-5]MBE3653262.1 hypothetical protein [Vibrio navarrensis]MBE3656619.1 hypothetical protein [Vibrio navarrensis]MBE3661220.1 hypothetical protein [Vibrio navarrensis]MBE3668888.1 hypothetical protein [Vibrio navarrensis]
MRSKWLLAFVGASAATAVALGAFAAHGLKSSLAPYLLEVFETGVTYQFWHTLAIALCALLLRSTLPSKAQNYFFIAAICFIIGIFCFSGSLYALALTGIKWFGPVTPLGGLMFMVGWLVFMLAALKTNEVSK